MQGGTRTTPCRATPPPKPIQGTPKRSQAFDFPQLDQVKYNTPSAHQGETYQSLGWNLGEWRRVSLGSQKGPGSRNASKKMGIMGKPTTPPAPRHLVRPLAGGQTRTDGWPHTLCSACQIQKARTKLGGCPIYP